MKKRFLALTLAIFLVLAFIPISEPTAIAVGQSGSLQGASNWAVDGINMAFAARLVPDSIANAGWQNPTTRLAAADAMECNTLMGTVGRFECDNLPGTQGDGSVVLYSPDMCHYVRDRP